MASLYNLSEDELKERWLKISDSLCKKKYIKITGNKGIMIDNPIHYMITSCCNPEKILVLSFLKASGKNETKIFYINSRAAIEVETDQNNSSSIVVTPYNSASLIYKYICETYPEDETTCTEKNKIIISSQDFYSITDFFENHDFTAVKNILIKNGMAEEPADDASGLMESEGLITAELFDKLQDEINAASQIIILNSGRQYWQVIPPNLTEFKKVVIANVNTYDIREKLWDMVFTAMKGFTVWEEDGLIEG